MAPRKAPLERRSHRTAEQIGRTSAGPRPVPDLARATPGRWPSSATAVLDSGLTVLAARKPRTPMVEIRLRIPFGGRTRLHSARAELLASAVLLGTGRRSRADVDADLAAVGGELHAQVDPQRLSIAGSVLCTGLPVLLEVLADCLTDPAYRAHDITGERGRLVEHLAMAAAQPSVQARRHLQERRFGEHPATWEMPDAELVAGVGRAAVTGLHRRSVVPAGSTLVLVGDLSPRRALAAAGSALASWAAGTATPMSPPPPVTGAPVAAFHRPGTVQSQVRLSVAAPRRTDPDYPAAQLANLVFGGYFSSRLVENIREDKGYTYGAHSTVEFWPGSAALTVSFDTNTASTAPALLETFYELGRIALVSPRQEEVVAARNYVLGSLATSLSTQAGYAAMLTSLAAAGLDETWLRRYPAALRATTTDEVAAAASSMLAPANVTGVVLTDLDVAGGALGSLPNVLLP